jgi:hypothetical protein
MTQPQHARVIKALNIAIILSLLILPTLFYFTATNIIGIANTLNLQDTNQTITRNKLAISATLTLTNPGPFKAEATLQATLSDARGKQFPIQGPQLSLPTGTHRIPLTISLDLTNLGQEDLQYLALNSDDLTLTARATVALQPIASVSSEAAATLHWLPLIHGLTFGELTIKTITPNLILAEVQISFENQSQFPLNAVEEVTVFDANGLRVGEGHLAINAEPETQFSQPIELKVTPPATIDPFNDHTYTYTVVPTLTLQGYNVTIPVETKRIQIQMGALIKDLKTTANVTPIDLTNSRVNLEVTYTNNNQYIPLDAAITPKIMKGGETILTGNTQNIHTNPSSQGSISSQITIPNSTLLQGGLRLVLYVSTNYGDFELEAGPID